MAGGILGGLFGGSGDSSVMPGLLDQAGYMDPAEYDRRRQGDAMQGLWAGLLQGSGPSLEPRNFFSALGGGLAASQKSANEFDEAQLRRAQGLAAFQKSALERQKLKLATDIYGEVLPKIPTPGAPGTPPVAPGAAPDTDAGGGSGRGAWGPHADVAIATLREQGFSEAAIQGIMANGLAEGGFDTPWRKAGGGENSLGHWQFNQSGELPGYLDFVRQQGGDPKDTRLQALYVAKRAEEVAPGFKSIDDPQKATDLFATKFERYAGAKPGQRYGLLTDAQRYMTGKPVEAVAPLAEVPRYGSDFERLPSETAIPGLIVTGAPGPAPAPGATAAGQNTMPLPDNLNQLKTQQQQNAAVMAARGIPLLPPGTQFNSRGAAISPDLSRTLPGQQSGPPNISPAIIPPNFATPRPSLSGGSGGGTEPSPLPPDAGEIGSGGEAPVPGGITYGSGVLGRAAAAVAAGAPAAAVPAAAAPAPGGTLPGAAAAPAPALPAPPELPPIPAIAMPQPLPPPPAAAALRPLETTGAAPAVQLSPEQVARTQRAQRLSLALDLIGVTVPKFIADEAGIDVAARSAAAQEAAKQPFAVQLKRLEAETTAAQKQWDARSDQQKETLAAQRNQSVKEMDAQYANIHEWFKSELDLFTAGPKAEAIAAAQLPSEKAKITHQTDEQIRKDLDTLKDYKVTDPVTQEERTITMTPRQAQRMGAAGPTPGLLTGLGPLATAESTARGTELGQLNKTIDENARVARTNIADLKNMQTAAQGLAMRGIFADQTQFANQLMNALTGEQKDRVAAYEMVTKNSEKLVREQTRLSDNQPAAIQLVMTRNSMPTARTSEIGFDGVVSQMLGAHEYGLYVQQEKEKWLNDPAHRNSLRGFEAQLPVSPYAFMVYRMPEHLENQLMAKLRAGGAQGIREAQMLKDQISTLRNQGYGQ